MSKDQALSVLLPPDVVRKIKEKVASGEYATEGEVIRDGLRGLEEHDAATERWLREEAAESCREVAADRSGLVPVDDVLNRIKARRG